MSNRIKNAFVTALRRLARKVRGLFVKTQEVANPILRDPYHRPRSRKGTRANNVGRKRLAAPPCLPGTITYHDRLVKHVGYNRKLADKMQATGDLPVLQ